MNVLIVDDIPTNRKLLRVMLESEGYDTIEAADGVEALAVLAREAVDAVISDILMPNMDGFRLCREIRKSERLHSLPFIVYTGTYTSADDMKLGGSVGADRYLTKPSSLAVILQSLREVTAPSESRKPAPVESDDEAIVLRQYSQALVHKLEEKNIDLQQALESQRRAHERIVELNTGLERRVRERTTELEQTHKRLLEVSRLGGMAEVAESVLHNVGNALNSVNTSAGLLLTTVKKSAVGKLPRIVALLREHAADLGAFIQAESQGRQLPPYLIQLFEQLAGEQVSTVAELHLLQEHIQRIKEVIAMQQRYTRVAGVTEMVDVREVMEEVLRMIADTLSSHGIEVARDFAEVPEISAQKHKIVQILVNLLRNASVACAESGSKDRRITLRVAAADGAIRLSVTDDGAGIAKEDLTRIFAQGFSTRGEGHGFGLHTGALVAKELGGSLVAQSEGLGTGATFTLQLPLTGERTAVH